MITANSDLETAGHTQNNSPVGAVMVAGGGIAGIQASLDLADSGYLVYLVEEKPAIGGVMAQLDKTFPTNDCSMCVISPKLVEAGRHLNINLLTCTEILSVEGKAGNFEVALLQHPRFVDIDKCTSCGECAKVCPIEVPNQFDQGLGNRKAAFKLYPQGMPGAYAIEKKGTAPCKVACPAHVSIQGYIALINDGRYPEAIRLFRDAHPFPGICGRVCHHPCENECTRKEYDAPLAIRELHRFLADWEKGAPETYPPAPVAEKRDEKIAIIGSGPAGLSAAYFLARSGYRVTVFEKLPKAGGMMAVGIPEYRLPREILEREIRLIEDMGVEIRTGITFGKDITFKTLEDEGFSATFLAVGLHGGRPLGVENEDADGVIQGVDFLRDVSLGRDVSVGRDVVVIGGGNVAIDVALTAKRKGAETVTLICLEKREEMPAWSHEIAEALESDIRIVNSYGPKSFFIDPNQVVTGIEFKTCSAVFDESGRFAPQYDESACEAFFCDQVIVAIGQSAACNDFSDQTSLFQPNGGLTADPVTLQTAIGGVFAGGDALYGPRSVVEAVACGKQAAESIHRYVNKMDLSAGREEDWTPVRPEGLFVENQARVPVQCLDPSARECNFLEVSFGYNKEEALKEANRCLKCGVCSECYQCVSACLAGAVDHQMRPQTRKVHVGGIILAPGFQPFDPSKMDSYAYTAHPNVVTSLEFERILSASGPFQGHLMRLSDKQEPKKIAWLQCVGSRDLNRCDHAYCSSVCCMYAAKQAVIAKEHANDELDTAIFYMDMRTYGKEFERYRMRAETETGVRFVRSRVHTVTPLPDGNLQLRYVLESGKIIEEEFDLVVLSIGLSPDKDNIRLARRLNIALNDHGFAETSTLLPVSTSRPGIYTCGAFQEPKDIPMSVMEASAAAAFSSNALSESRHSLTRIKELPPELDVSGLQPRVGIFVCNCGINIGGIADVPAIREYAKTLPYVVHVEDNLFTCSQDTQDKMKAVISEKGINRVVVASCSPRTHEPLFQETIREAGLNPFLFEMANIRDQNTWVHMNDPAHATEKAKDLVRMAAAKAVYLNALHPASLEIKKGVLVVGGGVAGMEAALGVAQQGFQAYLVEKDDQLGGVARKLNHTWKNDAVPPYVDHLIEQVMNHPRIRVFLRCEPVSTTGVIGNFRTSLIWASGTVSSWDVEHGATILATGGHEYRPTEFLYGQHPDVLTHLDLDAAMREDDPRLKNSGNAVFIQCVGSRTDDYPYCSKVCCTHSLKSAIALKEINPGMDIYILYRDIRTYGFRETLYQKARKKGILFIRFDPDHPPRVNSDNRMLTVTVTDHILGIPITLTPDLLVLAAGIRPNANQDLFELFKVPVNADGFLVEAHAKLRPVDFASDGIFMAGLAHYPKPLEESITQARAAVSRAVTIISKDEMMVGGVVADLVDPSKCACCLVCVRSCPYGVPYVRDGRAHINPAQCHGCGVCAAECPAKVITLNHFTDEQLLSKTRAMFFESTGHGTWPAAKQ